MTLTETLQQYVERAVPVCGWPEWREGEHRHQLAITAMPKECGEMIQYARFWLSPDEQEWCNDGTLTDHEALCIWRDWVRTWLASKGINVLHLCGIDYIQNDRNQWWVGADGWQENYGCDAIARGYPTYDGALLAAMESVV